MMKAIVRVVLAAVVAVAATACHTIDDDLVPPAQVNISFTTEAQWTIYGAPAAMDCKTFIFTSTERVPAGFPYMASSATGFAGVMLVGDVNGTPRAFDLACPVDPKRNVRLFINDNHEAQCPVCGSRYDVFSLEGYPVGGPAADKGYGLRQYRVARGRVDFMLVSY
ncbi:MAG: hypothetical protein J6C67_02565 [Muribaculaceae bacterium]|nr:hypothetical protein [Muribaculaceae bacterium]